MNMKMKEALLYVEKSLTLVIEGKVGDDLITFNGTPKRGLCAFTTSLVDDAPLVDRFFCRYIKGFLRDYQESNPNEIFIAYLPNIGRITPARQELAKQLHDKIQLVKWCEAVLPAMRDIANGEHDKHPLRWGVCYLLKLLYLSEFGDSNSNIFYGIDEEYLCNSCSLLSYRLIKPWDLGENGEWSEARITLVKKALPHVERYFNFEMPCKNFFSNL